MKSRPRAYRDARLLALILTPLTAGALAAQGGTSLGGSTGIDPVSIFGAYNPAEHESVHSSLPLQGNRQAEKWAPILDGGGGFAVANFRTGFVVNNPSSTGTLNVTIEQYDSTGALAITSFESIAPNGISYTRSQIVTPPGGLGLGNVRVVVDPSSEVSEFVGSTVYYVDGSVANPFGGGPMVPPIAFDGFMASTQPLQQSQPNSSLISFGPFPAHKPSAASPLDLVNGVFGFVNIVNPLAMDRTVRIYTWSTGTNSLVGIADYALPARGAIQDVGSTPTSFPVPGLTQSAWARAQQVYTDPNLANEELVVYAQALDGLPLVGEGIMLDLITDVGLGSAGEPGQGQVPGLGGRIRMTSFMATYTPSSRLINPELVVEGNTVTSMGIYNFGRAAASVRVQYWTRDNVFISEDVIAPLNTLGAVVIGPNMATSPNFPTGPVFSGTARIFAERLNPADPRLPLLGGWANRGNEGAAPKMYGELLIGGGGAEHSRGWTEGGQQRSWISLAFDDGGSGMVAPGYATFINDTPGATGTHTYEFFTRLGQPAGIGTFPSIGVGLTSFTYEDGIIANQPFSFFHSGRVSITNGAVSGISTIGGPLLPRQLFEGFQGYRGPGDTVP